MSIDVVIFDCDGVPLDSEPLAKQALLETNVDVGLSLDPALGHDFLELPVCAPATV